MALTHHCVVVGDAGALNGALGAVDVESVSAAEAPAVVEATAPACVVIVGSADGDGLESVEAVRAVSSTVPVVYATPEPAGRVAAAATQAGADEYVVIGHLDEDGGDAGGAGDDGAGDDAVGSGDGDDRAGTVGDDTLAARIDALVDETPEDDLSIPRIDDDQLAAVLDDLDDLSPGGHATVDLELERADGERVRTDGRFTRLPTAADGSGADGSDAAAYVGVVRDVAGDRRRETTIRRLLSTTRTLFACDTATQIADTVTVAAAEVFGYDYVAVRLYDEETDELVLESGTDAVYEQFGDRERVHVDSGRMGASFESGEPVLIDDVRDSTSYDFGPLRGAMCIPVGSEGMLTVCSPTVSAFSVADAKLAQLLTTNAEAALQGISRRETLVRYEHVLEAVEGMVYALDADGHFTLVTEPFAERLGYERDDLVGEHASVLLTETDVDRAKSCIRTLLSDPDRSSITYEAAIETAIGGEFPVEIEISLLPFDDGFRGTVGTVRDVTERKERERYLQILNRVLRHNLRNDLTVVMGYADILNRSIEDEHLAETAETVHDISTDLAKLSEDAKHIERTLRRGKVDGHPVDLAAIVDHVVRTGDWARRGADIAVDVSDDLRVRADDELITALVHLVENAVEHNTGPDPTVRISARRSDRTVTIAVEDDGPGIPRGERDIITGESDITQLTHGSGLGLWLVRWIVDSYGGQVSFARSELGGSRVEISLEAAPSPGSSD